MITSMFFFLKKKKDTYEVLEKKKNWNTELSQDSVSMSICSLCPLF